MNNADLIIATLKANGVTRGFGIPSGNVLPLMEAMRTGGIEFVLTAHEGSAGFAADVTGRMTGAPGLCLATLGPGATNLATGVGGAFLDRSPVIAITCNLNTDQLGRRIQMWIDHHALFKPITKATLRLERGCVAETVTHAIALALTEPKGPVHLDLPEDVALAATNERVASPAQPGKLAPAPDAALARAGELLAASERPIAVLGSTAMRVADPSLLRRVIERHNLPFATTTMAKGMIDDNHPLALGCIERSCRQIQRKFLRSADLIVGLGYDTVEVEYEAWIGARRDRRGPPRSAARGSARLRCRGAHAPDREPMERGCAQDVPHHQWLVFHGLCSARRDRGQACAPAGAGGLPAGRRLLSDDLRRGRDRQAARHHASDRRPRRPLARAHQGEADPAPIPALRHRTASGGLSRAAGALFRRARARSS